MQTNHSKRSCAFWAPGIAALWAALIVAAGGSALAAPTETVLHSFTGGDGAFPKAGLIADSSGNLYSTTENGGASGQGVVFKLPPGGTETVLHAFTGGSDGGNPVAGLIADSSGNLYGTTENGAASAGCPFGCGVVFKLSPGGTETVLHTFTGATGPYDGANPQAGLYADSGGNLYGTTHAGSSIACSGFGCGTVFKLSPGGTETVLGVFGGPRQREFSLRRPDCRQQRQSLWHDSRGRRELLHV